LVELVYRDEKSRSSLEMQRKPSKIQKRENFFRIPKLSNVGRSSKNVLGKFQKCGPWSLNITNWLGLSCV